MNTPLNENPSITQRSTILRCIRWLMRPKVLGRIACVLITLLTLIFLFYQVEHWRGKRAWKNYESEAALKGLRVDWESYLPPPVPEAQNFALTPVLAPICDFVPGTQTPRDTNASQRLSRLGSQLMENARKLGFDPERGKAGTWARALPTDLICLLATNKTIMAMAQTSATITASWPKNQTQAANILLDLLRETFDPVFEELRAASQKPACRFNIPYDHVPVCNVVLPHLANLKNLVQRLGWRANANLVLGNASEAYDDVRLAWYLGNCLRQEPFLISYLVRISCRFLVIQALWEGMNTHQWTDAQLRFFQEALAKDDWVQESYSSLQAEQASGARLAEQIRGRKVALGQVGEENAFEVESFQPLHRIFPTGWYYFEQLYFCRASEACRAPIRAWLDGTMNTKQTEEAIAQAEQQVGEDVSPFRKLVEHRLLARILLPAIGKVFEKALRIQATSDLARVACALERHFLAHGNYPENLNALVPPFASQLPQDAITRGPFKYRRDNAKAYVLYSVGSNLTDDGGTVATNSRDVVDYRKGDWVWRIPAK